jgi:lipid-A-disaccharide synthase
MRYYIIAGEASGDLHGSNLIRQLHRVDKEANIRCWGGDLMEQAGAALVKHYRDLAFMGFAEVVMHLPTIFENLSFCKKDIKQYKPDALILIDYPGFNLRIARWAHRSGYKVIYYISPQVWAWKESRVKLIRRCVDKMLVILPFEKAFYQRWDYAADYVGHPLLEVVKQARSKDAGDRIAPGRIIALLPGSRRQEVLAKLPLMLKMTRHFPDYTFVVARAPHLDDQMIDAILKDYPRVITVENRTYDLLKQADAALVTSGTATLETALFNVPQVVCYKGNPLSYFLARKLIKVKYISLVNLIMDKEVVKELIQYALNEDNLAYELGKILQEKNRKAILEEYRRLWDKLDEGDASLRAAEYIVGFLNGANT